MIKHAKTTKHDFFRLLVANLPNVVELVSIQRFPLRSQFVGPRTLLMRNSLGTRIVCIKFPFSHHSVLGPTNCNGKSFFFKPVQWFTFSGAACCKRIMFGCSKMVCALPGVEHRAIANSKHPGTSSATNIIINNSS